MGTIGLKSGHAMIAGEVNRKVKLSEIFEPVNTELLLVKAELDKIANGLESSPSRAVFEHFFKIPGKLLRPSLLLLSAATVGIVEYNASKPKLVKTAAAIELVHNASLIHDDIVDHEMLRRGQKTLNNAFGSKIAVTAGSTLLARAVSILLEELSKENTLKVLQMIRKMSTIEITQLNGNSSLGSREDYIRLIEGKTALLMSNSCMLSAGIVTSDKDKISAIEQFGLNFGMAYQIVDDYIDQDHFSIKHVDLTDAREYSRLAVSFLEGFDESTYKTALIEMLEYILSLVHINSETKVKSVKK